ncbi:DUF6877 family protein [Paraliobacillus sp. X-1268]|uniref:DUF6877 family protein n=1 Tax=Paraliobacillus sp. X-1268 TaxID=2213193 RepID=UPI001E2AB96F|nr:DUF6877 family protein [Paraliobacillus sp. X-1268]
MSETNAIQEISLIANQLPLVVLQDINQRIGDWLSSGGNENDSYIKQQLRFAKRFVKD